MRSPEYRWRRFRCGSFSLPQEVHVNEFDTVEEVLRPLWETMLVDAEGFIGIRSLRYLAHQYFQLSVKLVAARV